MKIHEFQAREILQAQGIPVPFGILVRCRDEAEAAIAKVQEQSGSQVVVVKAQIHAGGRGKGGGVKVAKSTAEALAQVDRLLGSQLITPQTGPEGQTVRQVLITEGIDIAAEYYLAITLDRARDRQVIMASAEGGVEIEEVARRRPEKILKEWVDPAFGLQGYQLRALAAGLGFSGDVAKQAHHLIANLCRAYLAQDASLAEINPLVLTGQGKLIALDAKFNADDNALYRQRDIAAMRDPNEEDPTEVEAGKYDLNYIKLDGQVGCMVNGAGLAMATMDIIKLKGGEPANFLDVGGGASAETVKNGFRIILSDPSVKAVLINIFGGIVRCDRVANGIVAAARELDLTVPVVVRLEGTNADEAKQILRESGLDLTPASSLDDAAAKAVAAAR